MAPALEILVSRVLGGKAHLAIFTKKVSQGLVLIRVPSIYDSKKKGWLPFGGNRHWCLYRSAA